MLLVSCAGMRASSPVIPVAPNAAEVIVAFDDLPAQAASITVEQNGVVIGTLDPARQLFSVRAVAGRAQEITVTAYADRTGTGEVVARGSVVQTLAAGSNGVRLTIGGKIASIYVAVAATNGLAAGIPANVPVVVTAKDNKGRIIAGLRPYNVPIALVDSDKTGTTKLRVNGKKYASKVTIKSPAQSVTLKYDGGDLTDATLAPVAKHVKRLYSAVLYPRPSVSYFALPGSTVNVTGAIKATAITTGSDGNLWFPFTGYLNNTCCTAITGIGNMTLTGSFTIYNFGYTPNASILTNPSIVSIVGSPPGSSTAAFFVDETDSEVGSVATNGAATLYPSPTFCSGIGPVYLNEIVSDGSTGYWVTVSCGSGSGDQLLHVASDGSMALSAEIAGFVNSYGLAIGKDGRVYVAGEDSLATQAAILQATISGSSVTATAIAPSPASSRTWSSVVQSADGDFWVTSSYCVPSLVARLHPAAIFSNSTYTAFSLPFGCARPNGLVALPDDSIWATSTDAPLLFQIIPAAAEGVPAIASIPLASQNNTSAQTLTGALGPDGHPYFFDNYFQESNPPESGEIFKIAY
jgi:hypothetical protein